MAPAAIGFAGRGLGAQHANDLFVGAARTFLDGGYLFEFKFDRSRLHFAFSDPNLTDKRFPGNPTRSYRTRAPLRIAGELTEWEGHAPEQLQAMKDGLARLASQGGGAIED